MLNEQEAKLEMERARGELHQRAWDQTVEPFFNEKQAELFEMFNECPTIDRDLLMDIKMQMNVLKSMRIHFASYIQTGDMASQQLGERNEH